MFERDLTGAFNHCADLLADGQTIDECLRRYPQFARDLRPMLETGMLVRRARYTPQEVMQAQDRVRFRIAQATASVSHPGAARSYTRWLPLVASLIIVFLSLFGGASIAAETTLPGDFLYPVKRASEAIRMSLDSTGALEAEFARRRIDEISQLLTLARPASVDFRGEVESINGAEWRLASLTMRVGASVPGAAATQVGDTVQVSAQTTAQGELVADEIHLLERRQEPLLPSPTPTQTITQTPTVTTTPVPPTNTPRPTQTPPPTAITVQQESACAPTPPDGWVSYALRAGDTLSALAIATGETVERIIEVNCITNPTGLVVGEQIYLPFVPPTRPPSVIEDEAGEVQSTGDGDNDGASGSEAADDEGDDDNSGPGGDEEDDDDSSGPGSGDDDSGSGGGSDDEDDEEDDDNSGSGDDDDDSSDEDGDDDE